MAGRRSIFTVSALAGIVIFLAALAGSAAETSAQSRPQTGSQAVPPQAAAPSPAETAVGKLVIKADYKERLENKITASGNVEIRYGEIILCADQVVYDETTKDALAVGHVTLIRPDETFSADRFALNMETGLGRAENVVGLVQPEYRYESDRVERESPDLFRVGKSTITGCSQPVPRWKFSASRAEFVRNEYIKMWDPVFKIKDVPIFYLPYLKYPLDRDRATGFLFPRIGYSKQKGLNLTQQFYWAMARNMDATFSLDYYAAKGAGGGLEFRYLFEGGWGGRLNAFYFGYRTPSTGVKPEDAVIFRWSHNQPLPGDINLIANIDYQNSFSFSREFDNDFSRALVYNRSSQVYVTKSWAGANMSLRLGQFETSFIARNYTRISRSLPQLNYYLFKRKLWGPIYFSLSAEYNNWQYGDADQFKNKSQVKSSDFSVIPRVNIPFNEIPWLNFDFTASGNLNYYGRSLDPDSREILNKGLLSGNGSFSATMTGPVFFRVFNFQNFTKRFKHIIQPTISYRYDTPTLHSDRIVTMSGYFYRYHYLDYGIQNQVLFKSGEDSPREILSWTIAQAFYVDAQNSPLKHYRLKDGSIPRFSDVSSSLRFFPSPTASLDFNAGFNPYYKTLSSIRATASYRSPMDSFSFAVSWYKSLNPYYEFDWLNREQIGFSGGAKIPGVNLEALGECEFNIIEKRIIYTGFSAVWHFQCIDFRALVRGYFFREKPEVQVSFSIGLGNIGTSEDILGRKGR